MPIPLLRLPPKSQRFFFFFFQLPVILADFSNFCVCNQGITIFLSIICPAFLAVFLSAGSISYLWLCLNSAPQRQVLADMMCPIHSTHREEKILFHYLYLSHTEAAVWRSFYNITEQYSCESNTRVNQNTYQKLLCVSVCILYLSFAAHASSSPSFCLLCRLSLL